MPSLADNNLTEFIKPARRRSLHTRTLVALMLVFSLGFSVAAAHVYGTRDELRRAVLLIQAQEISRGFSSDQPLSNLPRSFAGSELGYTLYDANHQLLGFSDNLQQPKRLRTEMLSPSGWWRWSPHGGQSINAPVALPDGAILMVSKNDASERAILDDLLTDRLRHSLMLSLPVGLLTIGLIVLLLRWTLRPVQRAAVLARGIGPNNPEKRIPLASLPTEFHPLASAANAALDRLAGAYTAERRFIADAAHELRTPLTVLDLRLQDARHSNAPDWPRLEAEMQHLRQLVAQLLELARQEGVAQRCGPSETINTSRLTREAIVAMLPLFEAQGRGIDRRITDGLNCRGNSDELRSAIVNLLENALVHGAGDARVSLYSNAGTVVLEVADQGPGVPEQDRAEMFRRFRKGRQGSPGTGLGLAIVKRVVENAGGQISFAAEHSSCLRIELPRITACADSPALA